VVVEASSTEDSTSSATAENTDATSESMADTAAAAAAVSATATAEVSPRVNGSTHRTTTSSSRAAESSNNNIQSVAPRRKGIWTPPSQNAAQRRGSIFSIQQPQDLLDFVIEDERLSVVKVYASWCKTCQVFDVRYRKLASQLGDKQYNPKAGNEIISTTQLGRVRFAEMRYDDPNNEEMCKLLDATKLPHILMYKGSKGKVADFQCGPAKFKLLVDAVNEHADPIVSVSSEEVAVVADDAEDVLELSPPPEEEEGNNATMTAIQSSTTSAKHGEEDTIDGLKQQLADMEEAKLEMFEIMKAQIEHDKAYIAKLENGVETQRSMLESKDGEMANMTTVLNQQQSALESKNEEIKSLRERMSRSTEETRRAEDELSIYKSQVAQLTDRISNVGKTIASLERTSSINERSAQEKERQLEEVFDEWKEEKAMYEGERNSLRKLGVLAVKRVGRGVRNFVSRGRRR